MGLNCKICKKELDAFSGGRCRHCRQLVCEDCIAHGTANATGGLLCKDCESHQVEATVATGPSTPVAPPPVIRRVIRTPAWVWGVIAAVMAGAFLFVVIKPYVDDSEMVGRVINGTDEEYSTALDDLAQSGGRHALNLLQNYALTTRDPIRARAIRAIGALPGEAPLRTLQEIYDAPNTRRDMRSLIYEALLEHVFRHPAPPSTNAPEDFWSPGSPRPGKQPSFSSPVPAPVPQQ